MIIDWFTVVAQGVNFLILVWLLKRFLYQPVLRAIAEREDRIGTQLREADARKHEAEDAAREFHRKNQEFDRQRDTLLHGAAEEARAERERLVNQARQDADALRDRLSDSLRTEQDSLRHEIGCRTRQEVFAISRQALADLASTALEAQMAEVLAQRLRETSREDRERFTDFAGHSEHGILVKSAFELPDAARASIQQAVNEVLAADADIRYEVDSELVSGLELLTNGYKIGWSVGDYLESLEKKAEELVKVENEHHEPGN